MRMRREGQNEKKRKKGREEQLWEHGVWELAAKCGEMGSKER